MNKDLSLTLLNDYPFVECSIDVGDGWYDILQNCLEQVYTFPIHSEIRIVQIKEKFGCLRIYWEIKNSNIDYNDIVITELDVLFKYAENMSQYTCENCGKPGELRSLSWLRVLCDTCLNFS